MIQSLELLTNTLVLVETHEVVFNNITNITHSFLYLYTLQKIIYINIYIYIVFKTKQKKKLIAARLSPLFEEKQGDKPHGTK